MTQPFRLWDESAARGKPLRLEHVSNLRLEQVTSCSTCHFCGKISHHMTPGNL